MAVARITALFIGIVVGAYWHELFTEHVFWLAAAGILGSFYVLHVVVKQYKK
jgi:uncharacterized membrane protein YoaK (UPF0700 family)